MWKTSSGDRTLVGAEAKLVRDLAWQVRDMIFVAIDIDEPFVSDVDLFNSLQPTQQMTMLHEVCVALLLENVPPPELTAIREATVHVLFRELLALIEIELDMERLESIRDISVRSRVLLVDQERRQRNFEWADENSYIESADCRDRQQWSLLIESLADEILWDRDFELEGILADQDPGKSLLMKQALGIQHDYFSDIAADVSSREEFERIDRELLELLTH